MGNIKGESKMQDAGLDALKRELRRSAEEKAALLLQEGEAEAQQVLAQAREQGKQLIERAVEEAILVSAGEASRISSARLRARKISSEALEQGIGKAIAALLKQLASSSSPRNSGKSGYAKLFPKLAKKALLEVDAGVIRCRKQDAGMARKLGRVGEAISCAGGVLVESPDGRIKVDATFEALVEEHSEELKKKAFELLSGGKR